MLSEDLLPATVRQSVATSLIGVDQVADMVPRTRSRSWQEQRTWACSGDGGTDDRAVLRHRPVKWISGSRKADADTR